MQHLRQKLLTDFYCSPEKCSKASDNIPLPSISNERNDFNDRNRQNDGLSELLLSDGNNSLPITANNAIPSKVIRTVVFAGKENRKRRSLLANDSKQMILDAGQKQFGHQQCKQVEFFNYST